MLTKLASHNADIQRLVDKGYAVRIDGPHLVVRDIPYLDANRQLQQRVDVHRRSEDHLAGCDVVVWQGGRVAYDYTTDQDSANPHYAVMVRTPYNLMAAVEINVGSITPNAQRPQTIIDALRTAGIR